MSQAADEHRGYIYWDEQDQDFVDQAVAQGILAAAAVRSRYILLLQDKPGEGPVECRFFRKGPGGLTTRTIQRTHLAHLQKKLQDAGFPHAAENGLEPFREEDKQLPPTARANKAMSGEDASNFMKNKRMFINEKISMNAGLRDFDKQWARKTAYSDPSLAFDTSDNFDDVHRLLHRLVDEGRVPEKVWDVYSQNKNEYAKSAASIARKNLKIASAGDTDIVAIKEFMAQVLAYALIGSNKSQTNDPNKLAIESPSLFYSLMKRWAGSVLRDWENKKLSKTGGVYSNQQVGTEGGSRMDTVVSRGTEDAGGKKFDHTPADMVQAGKTRGRVSRREIEDREQTAGQFAPIRDIMAKMSQGIPLDDQEMAMRQQFLDLAKPGGAMHGQFSRDVIDTLSRQPVQKKKRVVDFDDEYGDYYSTAAADYEKYLAGQKQEVAGATGVVSPVKPGKDYQIEGDPAGSAKSMRKPFKKFVEHRDSQR
jgi:hypothetical protein